jgi:7,8-dihydroneopterin aldolase/epimerase/oxygenase
MDKLRIDGLEVQAIIGVRDWERQVRQTLRFDLELAVDASAAARRDALEDALDYGALARSLTEFVSASQFQLIETLAVEVADWLKAEHHLPWLKLRLYKPGAVPNAQAVIIEVER